MSEFAKQLQEQVMTDDQVLDQIERCLGDGVPINISTMHRGLEILMYERHMRQRHLATGLKPLKGRKANVYEYIVAHERKKGFPPSTREIAEAVGLNSSSTVHTHLDDLEKLGYIKRDLGSPRAIKIIGKREA